MKHNIHSIRHDADQHAPNLQATDDRAQAEALAANGAMEPLKPEVPLAPAVDRRAEVDRAWAKGSRPAKYDPPKKK